MEYACYLGHELHESGTLEYDSKLKRAQFITQSLEVRETFSFASPVEVLRALNLYLGSHYGAVCWDLRGVGATQYMNCYGVNVKLAWNCPRATRTYIVQQVLAAGIPSSKEEIFSRWLGFFKSLLTSPSKEVSVLARLCSSDLQSTLGRNRRYVEDLTKLDPMHVNSKLVMDILRRKEIVEVPDEAEWRLPYLTKLLEQRQLSSYRVEVEKEKELSSLIDSLCIN